LAKHQPFQVIGYHSCDKDVGLKVLSGEEDLISSENDWDWLGGGVYFWEQNPQRALDYAEEVAAGSQFNKKKITTPFVLGAIIQLGNCLNLIESESLSILESAHSGLEQVINTTGEKMPTNKGNNRKLDCAVIRYVHQSRALNKELPYDTIRSAFNEGREVYPGASFTMRHHLQICVTNKNVIRGYFLPRPIGEFNPYLFRQVER
jgi:hypothetical protein